MNGTLISINDTSATIDFINQTTAKQERKTIPIGGAVRPHVDYLNKNMIGKPVEFSVKKDINGKDQVTFVGKPKGDFKSGKEIKQENTDLKVGLLMAVDEGTFTIQDADGRTHRYCVGGENRRIKDKAEEFGTYPLKLQYGVTKANFLTENSQILGVPTKPEIAALTPEKGVPETKPNTTSTKPQEQYKCEVCSKDITEPEKSRSRLFYSKTLCSDCLKKEEIKHNGMAPPQKKTEEKPVSVPEGLAPPPAEIEALKAEVERAVEKSKTEKLQEVTTKDAARPPTPPASRISIYVVINLGGYESLKIGIDGEAVDRDKLRAVLDDELAQYGRNNELAKTAIDSYRKRILGGAV